MKVEKIKVPIEHIVLPPKARIRPTQPEQWFDLTPKEMRRIKRLMRNGAMGPKKKEDYN